MQVVTNENMQQLIDTRRVDEFKPPEAVVAPEVKTEDKARGEDGKFVAKDESVTADKDKATAAKDVAVDDDDPEDKDLPERVRKQIGKKHRAMKEAEEFGKESYLARLAAEKRADEMARELDALKNPKSRPNQETDEPKPEDFKTNAEYIDAKVEWKFAKKEADARQQRINEAQAQAQAEFVGRLEAERKANPEYDAILAEADLDVVPHVASYIVDSPIGPKIGLHFAQHPDELERIQKLSPIRAIAELGKLELKLEKPADAVKTDAKADAKADAEPAKVSKAPSPITTIASDSKTVVNKDPAKMSFPELRAYEREKERERAKR